MLNEELVFINEDLNTQAEVFEFLSKKIVEAGYAVDMTLVYEALRHRELEGATGMMDGFAIPHAKSDSIIKASLIVIKLKNGIDWDSMDGKKAEYIISMFIPTEEEGTTHLKILSQIARMLMRSEFKKEFIETNTKKELVELISSHLS